MGISLGSSYSYIYLLDLVLLISGNLIKSETLLEDVCHQTHDQAFCMNVLGSDPRTADAGLFQLGQITIDLGAYSATGTKVKIHSLLLSDKDPELDLNLEGGDAYESAYYCEDAFRKPPAYRSPLTDENYHLEQFGEIITIIANMLTLKA